MTTDSTRDSSVVPDAASGWANALGIWLAGCLILGLGCFYFLGRVEARRPDRFRAAVEWQVGFAVGLGTILLLVIQRLRARGASLRDAGWRVPTTKLATGIGFVLGLLFTSGIYAGIQDQPAMAGVDPFALHWIRFFLFPMGIFMGWAEEVMMRGFFMNELKRAGVGTGAQILLSGALSASYHMLQDPSLEGFVPSFVLFSMHAGLYVLGKRSLTPVVVAHGMYHSLSAPYHLMFTLYSQYGLPPV